jgi:hypothetical protein
MEINRKKEGVRDDLQLTRSAVDVLGKPVADGNGGELRWRRRPEAEGMRSNSSI